MTTDGLSKNELSWIQTLNVEALEAISLAEPTGGSPTWVTAPSSPTWSAPSAASGASSPECPFLHAITKIMQVKEQKARERLAKNRRHAKVSRERKRQYVEEMQMRVAEIEKENAALRAEVERELDDNRRLKETLLLDVEMCF